MKEMNGTVTLAYVEEDNRQRVIFRVIPLCTREGRIFTDGNQLFPDEASLRIVPDKREQSSFKERMRGLGGLCAIQLPDDGSDVIKVRQNRNYAPEQGEQNRFAIYSDIIYEFAPEGCFEVVQPDNLPEKFLSSRVLVEKGKMLYGPVNAGELASTDLAALKPFGNDHYLLHTVQNAYLGQHRIYWNPDVLLNWRQRRPIARKNERRAEEAAVSQPEAAEQTKIVTRASRSEASKAAPEAPAKPLSVKPLPKEKKPQAKPEKETAVPKAEKPLRNTAHPVAEKAEKIEKAEKTEKPDNSGTVQKAATGTENEPLPIGSKLEILDTTVSFDQQISMLKQPLSAGANRLSSEAAIPEIEEEPTDPMPRVSGTPLSHNIGRIKRLPRTAGDNAPRVVEQQIRGIRDETMGGELGEKLFKLVKNPLESLQADLELVWQNREMRGEALQLILKNPSIYEALIGALRQGGIHMQAAAAAEEQLASIEADRLNILMQLDEAKAHESVYRSKALASVNQKRREESDRLALENDQLAKTNEKLLTAGRLLESENACKLRTFLSKELHFAGGICEDHILLSPIYGTLVKQSGLAESIRVHMTDSGFSISDDEAMSLLIAFSLQDVLCLKGTTVADARRFAAVLVESLGLRNASAELNEHSVLEISSLLPDNTLRTPTVSIQPLNSEILSVRRHKTLLVCDETASPLQRIECCPVITVPAMSLSDFGRDSNWKEPVPASVASFEEICKGQKSLLKETESWLTQMQQMMGNENIVIPDAVIADMRNFLSVAIQKVRGGFMAAADQAVCYWMMPYLKNRSIPTDHVEEAFVAFPHALEALHKLSK